MRKVSLLALLFVFCGLYAIAQDYPKAELFGGFNVTHLDTEGLAARIAPLSVKSWYPGWEIAGQYNFTKLLGVKGDFSGNYGTPVSGLAGFPSARAYTFMGGPVFSLRTEHLTPFAHALFGGNHASVDASTRLGTPSGSENAFAMAFGGGVDWKLTRHFDARLGQLDYLYTKHCGNFGVLTGHVCILGVPGAPPAHQNNFRFATGIVIH